MNRTSARELAVRLCYSISENPTDAGEFLSQVFDDEYYASLKAEDKLFKELPDDTQMEYIKHLVLGVDAHSAELDGYIDKYAVGWKFGRIPRTAVAIMKVAMYELLYMPDIPNKAAINEAVELVKRYEAPEIVPFVNGVLGSFVKGELN